MPARAGSPGGQPLSPVLADPTADSHWNWRLWHAGDLSLRRRRHLLTRHTGLLTREIWQRQFAPLARPAATPLADAEVEACRETIGAGEQTMNRLGHAPDRAALAGLARS